jgi:triosephosphate isomerase
LGLAKIKKLYNPMIHGRNNEKMKKNLRKAVIAGNWKMNKTRPEAEKLISEIKPLAENADCEVVICVPFTVLSAAVDAVKGTNIKVGAQNVHFEASGAFTGEISAAMLKEIGAEYVIIGHSERRQYFGETDETVNKRTKAALAAGLIPIVCVGELLWEREADITEEVVSRQIKLDFAGIDASDAAKTVIAYEPVWAIGTGKTATSEQAQEACKLIRDRLTSIYGKAVAESITIQYGGSMNAANAAELVAKEDVDGGLIGGASLKAEDFGAIIRAATENV